MTTLPYGLIKALHAGTCIAFVGGGFSSAADLPSWSDLLRGLGARHEVHESHRMHLESLLAQQTAHAYDEAAQFLADVLGRDTFVAELRSLLGQPPLNAAMRQRLDWLAGLPFQAVLTTNFDGLLEGLTPSPEAYRRVLRPSPLPWWEQLSWSESYRPTPVVKIHGDVRKPDTVVLTRRDYRRLLYRDPYYREFLRAVLVHHTVLYLGFSFTDAYLNELRSEILALLDYDITQRPVAYAVVNDVPEFTQDHYRHHEGIEIIPFETRPLADGRRDFLGFDEVLRDLHEQSNPLFHFGRLLQGRRMLWVDPLPENNTGVALFFSQTRKLAGACIEDFTLDIATTAAQGLAFLEGARERPYDLLLTHWGDGQGRGGQCSTAEELLLEMRRRDLRSPVLIFSTVQNLDARKRTALSLGAQAYCYTAEALVRTIEQILSPGRETG